MDLELWTIISHKVCRVLQYLIPLQMIDEAVSQLFLSFEVISFTYFSKQFENIVVLSLWLFMNFTSFCSPLKAARMLYFPTVYFLLTFSTYTLG